MGRFFRAVFGMTHATRPRDLAVWLVFAVAAGIWGEARGAGSADLQVISSTREGIRFAVSGLTPTWDEVVIRGGTVTLYELQLPGFSSSGAVGGPRIPTRGGWLIVPPGTRPEVRVVAENWESAGGRPLAIEPTPVIRRGVESFDTGVSEIMILPGESIPAGFDLPAGAQAALEKRGAPPAAAALTLGDVGWWRGRRAVPYRLHGALVDGSGRAGQVLTGGTWEVRFVPDKSSGAASVPPEQAKRTATRNDNRFGGAFLNADQLDQLPTEAAYHGVDRPLPGKAAVARGDKAGSLLGFESRLAVTKTKLHRVSYASLRSRNLLPDVPIQESEIRLYQRRYIASLDDGSGAAPYAEIEVPIQMFGEGDAFDGDDYFVFYGLRLRDDTSYQADLGDGVVTVPGAGDPFEQNNEANFYWLAASTPEPGTPWSRMASATVPAAAGTPLANYRRTEHVEEQEAFRENLPNVSTDRLYYNNHLSTEVTAAINPLYSPDPNGTNAQLQVAVTGFNTVSRALRFELLTGSTITLLEDYNLASTAEVVRTYSVAPISLAGTSARVRLTSTTVNLPMVFSYLNWVNLSFDALYKATNNRLDFNLGNGTGVQSVEVTGFNDSDLVLFDITNPRQPVHVQLTSANVVADGAGWKLSIGPGQAPGEQRRFFAVGSASTTGIEEFVTFRSTVALDPADPTDAGGGSPDLIVVTHADFRDAIGRWVEHRIARSGGQLRVHVVDVQDLYDWYSGGLKDAWAIKRFANHAITRWNSWALMIVGDANENSLGKEVLPQARDWSTDYVPTHYHVQHASGFAPELMASDKWYTSLQAGANYPNDTFPFDVSSPWDMYCGRFPCNSVGELNNMIDKVITVESPQAGQTWRRRGIFFADDEWSNGLGIQAQSELTYKYGEVLFGLSERDSLARMWADRAAVPLDSVVVLLKPYMDAAFPYSPPPPDPAPRDLGDARSEAAASAVGPLLQALSQGGLVCHYQGHANPYVLSSEFWFEDRKVTAGRDDVDLLANSGKPWFFMGMGCHISDWAQNAVRTDAVPNERSLSEKMLLRANAGASGAYASSGFEFITANKEFGEYIFRRFVDNPPAARRVGTGGAGDIPIRSRWLTGELLWAAEADIKADKPFYPYPEMISQYVILGDPLMMLDAGEAQVTATLVGTPDQEISGEVEIAATDASNRRVVNLVARDEAGIDRVVVVDSDGTDLTSQVVTETLPAGATDHRIVNYSLDVPVSPYDHSLSVRVYDTGGALASDRHYELVLNMPQTAAFVAGGEVIDPAAWVFPAEVPVAMSARITSSAQLNNTMVMALTSETLTLSNIVFNFNKGRELDVDFTAVAAVENPDDTHSVVLTIDGLPTELVIQAGTGVVTASGIGRVYNYPNPMRDDTRFVFESDSASRDGVIRVFAVSGRVVARIPFTYDGAGRGVVTWNGRDGEGDELGNGTYLYRIEMETAAGPLVSDMQRLVVMR